MSEVKVSYGHRNMFESPLLCPTCGEANLHHIAVETCFRQHEDSPVGILVRTEAQGKVVVDSDANMVKKNPSPRRDGLRITFFCEHCHAGEFDSPSMISEYYSLVIIQHKGTTYMCWET